MKFIRTETAYYFEDEDGTQYRTTGSGYYWEKLYGQSWEPVYNYKEETDCIQAFLNYKGSQNEQS
jgi:hypothetical protein